MKTKIFVFAILICSFFSCSGPKVIKKAEEINGLVQLMSVSSYWTMETFESYSYYYYKHGATNLEIALDLDSDKLELENSEGDTYLLLGDAKLVILTAIVPLKEQLKKREEERKKIEEKIKI